MGIVVSFNRVSEVQLAQILADPDNYWDVIDDGRYRSSEPDGYLDKAWEDLSDLLGSAGTGIDLISDGDLIDGSEMLFSWSSALVRRTAERLRDTPFTTLTAHSEAAAFDEAELGYLRQYYDVLVKFFGSAAAAGSAAVMSMS
ncbi:DUF1877 family protein [Nocardia carnea]|uniref:DUF1877 family protein n=1 Tax=Nocardia carnea TaxID=37328 RepID=UPI002453AF90|nr:DUF1877 family protein [Nocardia carnea]